MPIPIANEIALGILSRIPSHPMTPKFTTTVNARGSSTKAPATAERNTSAAMTNTAPAICTMLSILLCTMI